MKTMLILGVSIALIIGLVRVVQTDNLLIDAKQLEAEMLALTTRYEAAVTNLQVQEISVQPTVMLASFGCTPEKPKPKPPEVKPEPVPPPAPPAPAVTTKLPEVKKPVAKKPAVTKVTKDGNTYTIKLNTNKLQKGQEVHLCIGYLYFPVSADKIGADGTAKVKVDWSPPGKQKVTAGVWSAGHYLTSMVVEG
jgi:hypothetical protein